jgi:hypothetical protein
MRVLSTTSYAAIAALVGTLACASNKARTDDTTQPDQAAAARDTTTGRDTLNGQAENPSGYHGMERDTTQTPPAQQTPSDTVLQNQGQGQPQDTAGYSGMERVDTTGQQGQPRQADTSGFRTDTTGMSDTSAMGNDSSRVNPSGLDSAGTSRTGDTTGYNPSQPPRDSVNQ